jgi:hypothetical protein
MQQPSLKPKEVEVGYIEPFSPSHEIIYTKSASILRYFKSFYTTPSNINMNTRDIYLMAHHLRESNVPSIIISMFSKSRNRDTEFFLTKQTAPAED